MRVSLHSFGACPVRNDVLKICAKASPISTLASYMNLGCRQWRKPGAEFGGRKFFQDDVFFAENVHFRGKNLFFSHRPGFRMFPLFSLIFRIFTLLDVVHDPFLTRKTPFFTLLILSRTSDNTTSQNIWGTNDWAVPHLKLWGTVPTVSLGFRPW